MTEHSILLRKSEEARLDQIFRSKCEDEKLSLQQYLLLALQRNMFSNAHRFPSFYEIFKEAAGSDVSTLPNLIYLIIFNFGFYFL
jgi:hypothetical protein